MAMFLITTAINLLFPSTKFHFMCITKCLKRKQLLLMKIMLTLSLYLVTKLKNQSITARKFKFYSTSRSCFT